MGYFRSWHPARVLYCELVPVFLVYLSSMSGTFFSPCCWMHCTALTVHISYTEPGTCTNRYTNDCARCILNDLLIISYARRKKVELQFTVRASICSIRRVPSCTGTLMERQKWHLSYFGALLKCLLRLRASDACYDPYGLVKEEECFAIHC